LHDLVFQRLSVFGEGPRIVADETAINVSDVLELMPVGARYVKPKGGKPLLGSFPMNLN
jgi:hypothetical protein